MSHKKCMCLSGPPQLCTPTFESGQIYSSLIHLVCIFYSYLFYSQCFLDNHSRQRQRKHGSSQSLHSRTAGERATPCTSVPMDHSFNTVHRTVSGQQVKQVREQPWSQLQPHSSCHSPSWQNKASAGVHRYKYSQPHSIAGRAAERSGQYGKDEAGGSHHIAN